MSLQHDERTIDLDIEGMTCASCVARVERRLERLDGVHAEVNLATERARVRFTPSVGVDELLDAVRAAGYAARVPETTTPPSTGVGASPDSIPGRAVPRDPLIVRLVVSALLTVPIVLIAMAPPLQFTGWQWASLVLATPVVAWGGWPFHRAAAVNLRHGALTMDSLVSLGTLTAYAWSCWALWFGGAGMLGMTHGWTFGVRGEPGGDVYLEVAAGVVTILLLGRVIEARSKRRAGASMRTLLDLAPREVTVLVDGGEGLDGAAGGAAVGREERVPSASLRAGARFVVRPGERIAADGIVVHGAASVDESMLTGEPAPVEVAPGSAVTAAAIVHGGRLVVRATRVGPDTRLAQIAALVEDAQLGKSRAQRLADRISAVFVPVVIAIAVVTAATWLLAGSPVEQAMAAAVAVLVIACPCALGLATPMALLVGTGRGADRGILITGPEALDRTAGIDTILLDKTGTITTGRMRLTRITLADDPDSAAPDSAAPDGAAPDAGVADPLAPAPARDRDAEALAVAAALERGSEHPIARAVVEAADAANAPHLQVREFRARTGLGVSGVIAGDAAAAGRPAFLAELGFPMPDSLARRAEDSDATLVAVAWRGEVRALLEVGDEVREGAAAAVARLRRLGLHPAIASGDARRPAERVALAVGVDEVHAGSSPEDKLALVRRLQSDGQRVAMVGDGVNDAAALAAADLGIAMGGGTDAAASASDLALLRDEPAAIPDAIELARATLRTIRGNLFWAFAYNVAAIPLAAAGMLNPMIAGAAMACSSVFVVLNSLRLRSA
ncbi:Cu+-exporting ATPase [Agromyces ramosus]|uniref:Cation-transporting P-type ATPase B n=1 Tax=Agromyces ramosus TaxID=33879 RepID=A0A4Q7MM66_9MICO|nr:cation-translocating P-type ATPase [Agromyces ramosus]RZS67719.1 Cu+-exporting ATPase [Agromyces ramosus]